MEQSSTTKELEGLIGVLEAYKTPKGSKNAVLTQSSVAQVPIYFFPDSTPREDQALMLYCMTLYGQSADTSTRGWKTWLFSYLVMAFPELKGHILDRSSSEYTFREFPADTIARYKTKYRNLNASDDESVTDVVIPVDGFQDASGVLMTTAFCGDYDDTGIANYCYAAILVFLSGKTPTPLNRLALTKRRPEALIREFAMGDHSYALLGEGRLSDVGLTCVHASWNACSDPKISVINHFSSFYHHPPNTPARVIASVMGLMLYSGMNYVTMIAKMLAAVPWTLEMPEFKAEYIAFRDSVKRLKEVDVSFQPFFKLAFGNACRIFRRKDLSALVAVSIIWAGRTEESMKNYAIDAGHSDTIDKWITLCGEHGIVISRASDQAVAHAL